MEAKEAGMRHAWIICIGLLWGCKDPQKAADTQPQPSAAPVVASASAKPEPSPPPPGMLAVPAGTFTMGTDDGADAEKPTHKVEISKPFFIDKTEVTVTAYRACVDAGKCTAPSVHRPDIGEDEVLKFTPMCNYGTPGRDDHPVNCVDLGQAAAFCDFVGKRLPTEAEWEYAARGTDDRKYPWGNEEPGCERAVVSGCKKPPPGKAGTMEVGSFPVSKSPFGAMDMAGNVWEWVWDGYDPKAYASHAAVDPAVDPGGRYGILRGGSWDFAATRLTSTYRQKFEAKAGHVSTGFRCVQGGTERAAIKSTATTTPTPGAGNTMRFRCPDGSTPTVVRTGCMCGNEILNPCKTGGLEPTLEGDTCVFHCPDPNTKLPPPKDEMEKCLQKCNDETGWRFMGQCQMQCEGEAK
jgi:formylglycine-generating enzyme required for sulfatase activity